MGVIANCCVQSNTIQVKPLVEKTEEYTKMKSVQPLLRFKSCITKEDIHKLYKIGKTIGKGFFSKVKEAYKINDVNNTKYAVKIIARNDLDPTLHEDFLTELRILKELDHPYVIKLYEVYTDKNNYYLVSEFLAGGDIYNMISKEKTLKEEFIIRVLFQTISALTYCHANNIVHRDLKPDNILFTENNLNSDVKIVDFGLSKKYSDRNELMASFLGTPYFVAPEVIDQSYTEKCDMWSIGATAFMLITGSPPFPDKSRKELMYKIKNSTVSFDQPIWKTLSPEAQSLVSKLLVKDPNKRLSAEQALNHPLFAKVVRNIHGKEKINKEILNNLIAFHSKEKFKQIVLSALIKSIPREEIAKLNMMFSAMDTDHEGTIDMKELRAAFDKAGMDLSQEDIDNLISRIDFDKNGKLNYSEFLVAGSKFKDFFDEQSLIKVFKSFDVENTGYIDCKNLEIWMRRSGKQIENLGDMRKIFKEVGSNNERINLQTFIKMIKDS